MSGHVSVSKVIAQGIPISPRSTNKNFKDHSDGTADLHQKNSRICETKMIPAVVCVRIKLEAIRDVCACSHCGRHDVTIALDSR